ncbi:hypothetical protein JK271_004676 [Escherichia coli]|nr:hypothetical protein [Escherichia coli]EHA4554923.1 hypothetical protein [Escherichia coli]EHA4821044.1 hypothetical protein [Escherichia coli]EHA4825692.1 hypothetical protein [Escherichia coli]EHA4839260.1 hypothetical protein [Escherichia coli]
MGALSGVAEPARPSGRCKGGHSPEPVHNAGDEQIMGLQNWHCCKVSDEAAFCLIQRPYISKTLLTRRISPRGSP